MWPTEPLVVDGVTVAVAATWSAPERVANREPIVRQEVSILSLEPLTVPPGARCRLGDRVIVWGQSQPPPSGLPGEWLGHASYWELAASHGLSVERVSTRLDDATGALIESSEPVWSGWGAWEAASVDAVERGLADWVESGSLYTPMDTGVRVGDVAIVDGERMRIVARRRVVWPVAVEWVVSAESGGVGGV